ncbi:uncharacterized protein involved in exopolysaccharide biosynthesis [Pararhizobium capsulatum DSM 1112]|uniref:Uncharacterized protein involved in exopolysaccharide biosynthesis n=1 Tax=Pararhizobium capsulatum DSM 1112 TaxID=1121113 RepID=A0ABU0BS56_9HYPH|nr:Wzz/FepE/Etk N-terminal domain-containing protein [Pararhizobium capsulatum]MDQ0321091.1 uncharacterized protein involved in exopolysaccharide biosynthesis [Pararhizobium capsulatum DSM 1112]
MRTVFDAYSILLQQRRLFTIFFLVLFIGGVGAVYLKRPTFESSAKLMVNMEGLGVSLSQAEVPATGPQVQAVEAVTSQIELLTSRDLVVELVDRLGMDTFRAPPPKNPIVRAAVQTLETVSRGVGNALATLGLVQPVGERDALIEQLSNSIRVFPVRQSQVIVVSLRWRTPAIPSLALSTLLELFNEKSKTLDGIRSEYVLFSDQVTQAAEALEKAEAEARAFDQTHDIADLAREKQMLIDRIDRLTAMRTDAGLGETATAPPTGQSDIAGAGEQLTQLRSRLYTLNEERAKALASFTPEHRTVQELDRQISETKKAMVEENAAVGAAIKASHTRLQVLLGAEQSNNRIQRNIELATQAYQTYRKVASDRQNMLAHETIVHVQTIDAPSQPIRPLGASRLIWAIAALVVSLVLAAIATLALNLLRQRQETTSAIATIEPPSEATLRLKSGF